jgi:protein-ribulosamine 3-kinase
MSILYNVMPEVAIKPLAWGPCASEPDLYFFLNEFHTMVNRTYEPSYVESFCATLAELHRKSADMRQMQSIEPTPEGNYGFNVPTHFGMLPQDNRWCETWEEFYIQGMTNILAFEEKTQGPSDELDFLATRLIQKVIPRLLRPLETEGRRIRPSLLHGDFQPKNVQTDLETGRLVMFDAGAFWGHNECALSFAFLFASLHLKTCS